MDGILLSPRSALLAACLLPYASLASAADPLRPLRVVQVEHAAESQVDESPQLQEPRWVIRHTTGLKVMEIKPARPPTW
jgi:hypothetical protein